MIALDTNVIVRFLVRDDEVQAQAARARLAQAETKRERLLIPLLVILETIWVLESAYGKSRTAILDAIEDLRHMSIIELEADDIIARLLADGRKYKADLADILVAHAAQSSGCDSVLTFDKTAAKLPYFTLLK
ncbi:MAG: PIN domain-containing protein [Anaerolineales bacterium]